MGMHALENVPRAVESTKKTKRHEKKLLRQNSMEAAA